MLDDKSTPANGLQLFDTAIFLFDDEIKYQEKKRVEQILWPAHCVQHSHGAKLHKDLQILESTPNQHVISLFKGFDRDIDSYSAFWDNQKIRETELNLQLQKYNVTRIFVAGLATDVCVYSTALHAAEYGYETFIIEDACRGVDEAAIETRLDELVKLQCTVIQSADVKALVESG
ncbi:unnamed protein product [Didymodactylos carnosus]|uniref:nicotinamidase n=1 Tax=Didymodactylos carnosus TaxID=1234261 RepID=A0A814DA84_9BILA|nr:unnamed protein product [Didymodactylos carnosus]CAF0979195.1 unnamed protein product [Didymodactylos carnosus]CAF3727306.1 unnamed protein product [Didymodactylos carnosus]CAF3749863.1 unnamed protein product [Didymodactylos carnosus]